MRCERDTVAGGGRREGNDGDGKETMTRAGGDKRCGKGVDRVLTHQYLVLVKICRIAGG